MKRFILLFITMFYMTCFISCKQQPTRTYTIYETGMTDYCSGANHNDEYTTDFSPYRDDMVEQQKTFVFDNQEYVIDYLETRTHYLIGSYDVYRKLENGFCLQYGISRETGIVVDYRWSDMKYATYDNGEEKTKEECLEIAKNHLSKFSKHCNDYQLVKESTAHVPGSTGYLFKLTRMIDGVKTSDSVSIIVTVHGKIYSHQFTGLDQMINAKLPTENEMSTINKMTSDKINDIYDNVKDKYEISFDIEDVVFCKLKDGKEALYYTFEVNLKVTEDADKNFSEKTNLIVIIE